MTILMYIFIKLLFYAIINTHLFLIHFQTELIFPGYRCAANI